MKAVTQGVAAASLCVALACTFNVKTAFAHHAFGFYDMSKSVDVTGTVQKYEWSNPHSWLFIEVPSASGNTVYGFEMVSVGELLRRGWAKNSVKTGDRVTVTFHPIRDGTPNGILVSATTDAGALIGKPANLR